MLKEFESLFVILIYNHHVKSVPDGSFSEDLKTAEFTPVYKKKKRTDKNSYRPASVLSNISRNCEDLYTIKCMAILTEFPRNTNVNLGKGTAFSTASFI